MLPAISCIQFRKLNLLYEGIQVSFSKGASWLGPSSCEHDQVGVETQYHNVPKSVRLLKTFREVDEASIHTLGMGAAASHFQSEQSGKCSPRGAGSGRVTSLMHGSAIALT